MGEAVDTADQKALLRRVLKGRPGYVEVPLALYEQLVAMLSPPEDLADGDGATIGFDVPEDDD